MILNPAFLYTILWLFWLFLYNLRLSEILLPLNATTIVYVVSTIIAFILGWLIYCLSQGKGKLVLRTTIDLYAYEKWLFSREVSSRLKILTLIFITGYLLAIILAGNLPILALFGIGGEIRYTEFGIPGLHGLFNATYLSVCNIVFFRQLLKPSKTRLNMLIGLCCWPFLAVTRQLFISLFTQLLFIFLLYSRRKIDFYSWSRVLASVLLVVFMFGYIGDLRFSRDGIIALSQPTFNYPTYLPSGLIWVYIYVASPINNLVNNIEIIDPSYFPFQLIGALIPSFARGKLYEIMNYIPPNWDLVYDVLNVSSIHQSFLMDLGLFLTPLAYLFFSLLFSKIFFLSRFKPKYGLALIVILHGIAMSVFSNLLFHLVFVAQFFIYVVGFRKVRF